MINGIDQLSITLERMVRLLAALDDLKKTVLPKNPELFAVIAEAPLDELQRLRSEIRDQIGKVKDAG